MFAREAAEPNTRSGGVQDGRLPEAVGRPLKMLSAPFLQVLQISAKILEFLRKNA